MHTVKVSAKGQLVIPSSLRKKCGLAAPGKALIMEKDGFLSILPLPDDPVLGARGMIKPMRPLDVDHDDYKREEHKLDARHEQNPS